MTQETEVLQKESVSKGINLMRGGVPTLSLLKKEPPACMQKNPMEANPQGG